VRRSTGLYRTHDPRQACLATQVPPLEGSVEPRHGAELDALTKSIYSINPYVRRQNEYEDILARSIKSQLSSDAARRGAVRKSAAPLLAPEATSTGRALPHSHPEMREMTIGRAASSITAAITASQTTRA
jgi:hypothetical protein